MRSLRMCMFDNWDRFLRAGGVATLEPVGHASAYGNYLVAVSSQDAGPDLGAVASLTDDSQGMLLGQTVEVLRQLTQRQMHGIRDVT